MDKVDVLIIGAGITGLSVAANITGHDKKKTVCLFEKNDSYGQETSSRNSEVIHSGIYYPTDSLKAKFCIEGNRKLYEYCKKRNIPYNNCGKLIVISEQSDLSALEKLYHQGMENGVPELSRLTGDDIKLLEPAVKSIEGFISPTSGIVDSHRLMSTLEKDANENECFIAYKHRVTGINKKNSSYIVEYENPNTEIEYIETEVLINCAGLYSDKISEMLGINTEKNGLRNYFFKGEYFILDEKYSGRIKRLIYPKPDDSLVSLGIHATISLDGSIRLGPNVLPVEDIEYTVDATHLDEFHFAATRYLPFIKKEGLRPDISGIRPKLSKDGSYRDFYIKHESGRGLPGYINLAGIESPGLTSCLSVGAYIASMVKEI